MQLFKQNCRETQYTPLKQKGKNKTLGNITFLLLLWYLAPFLFQIGFSIIIWKENILSNIIKNVSDTAQSLLCVVKQVQAILHSQNGTVLFYVNHNRGYSLKGIIWDFILFFQQRAQRMVWYCSVKKHTLRLDFLSLVAQFYRFILSMNVG